MSVKKTKDKSRFTIWHGLTLAIFILFVVFIGYPLFLVLYKSVVVNDSIGLSNFVKFFERKFYWSTLVNSFKVTIVATLISVAIGLPLAYATRNVKIKFSGAVDLLCIVAYLSPPFIGAYAWIQLLGRNGFITKIINSIFGIQYNGIYGFAGIVLVFAMQSFPLVYLYVSGAMKNMDHSLNEAAESLGSSTWKRIRTIIVPLLVPSLLASSLLVFMRVFSDFGTPMLIGEGYKTMPVLVYTQFMSELGGDASFAAALCVIVIGIIISLFFIQKYFAKKFNYSMTALKPIQPRQLTGAKNILVHALVYITVFIASLPQLVVIYTSFLKSNGGQVFTKGFSLDSYRNIFANGEGFVIGNTYFIGIIAILIIVVLGVLISYMSERKPNALTGSLDTLSMLPYIIPGSVLGISFLFAFNDYPLLLSGTFLILVISFVVRRLAYTIRSSTAIIGQISPSMEEAAVSLGSSEMKSFRDVMLPMMMPGVISGALMSWITVISELSSSIILYTSKTKTLTVAIYTEVIRGNYGNAAAFSTILTLTSIISLLLFFKISGKKEISL